MTADLRDRLQSVIQEHTRASAEKPYDEKKCKALQEMARELRAALRKERAV